MRSKVITFVLLSTFLLLPVSLQARQANPIDVVFLSPDDSRFWQMVGGFMHAVAEDLEMDLTIHTDLEKNRFSYRELLGKVLNQPNLPDYIVFMCKEKVTHDMLRMIGAAGIKAFTFNTDVPDEEIDQTGKPREKMDHWIGHLSPDNRSAGFRLATRLYDRFQERNGSSPNMLVGLSGTRDSSAAIDRNTGLSAMLETKPSMSAQLLFADWSEQEAQAKIRRLIDRYPSLDLVWSASDGMALGAMTGAMEKGLKPGEDILVGGIDWEQRTLTEIESGRMELSLGRHFMGGGLALLLIRDYDAGFDFADEGSVSLSYQFEEVNRENLGAVRQVLDRERWGQIDFQQFSQVYNDALRDGSVSASSLLDDFMDALSPDFR